MTRSHNPKVVGSNPAPATSVNTPFETTQAALFLSLKVVLWTICGLRTVLIVLFNNGRCTILDLICIVYSHFEYRLAYNLRTYTTHHSLAITSTTTHLDSGLKTINIELEKLLDKESGIQQSDVRNI